MAGPTKTVWPIEPHTRAKHVILLRYLHAWLPIITSQRSHVLFIDGFAGPGIYEGGEEGSPVIALRALIEHSYQHAIRSDVHFIFFEADKRRAERLEVSVAPWRAKLPPGSTASVYHGEYAELLAGLLDQLDATGKQLAPSLVFIDPFGVSGLPMDLVRRVLATRGCEVLINFMIGYVHRFINAPEFEPHLDAIFGTPHWRDARALSGTDRLDYCRQLYLTELTRTDRAGRARYVRAFQMRDRNNRPIYDLIFGTNHAIGIDRMKDAMWKVDAVGGERFSDATDAAQSTLLEPGDEQEAALLDHLKRAFAGRTVAWFEVEEAIRQSPYRVLKRPLLRAAKDRSSGITLDGPGRGITPLTKITFGGLNRDSSGNGSCLMGSMEPRVTG